MASFDVKRVTPLEWAGIGAGALAFIISFLPWVSVDLGGDTNIPGFDASYSVSAWNSGIGAWLPVLMLLAAGVLIVLPHVGTQVPRLALTWLGLAAGAFVIIILRWVTISEPLLGDAVGAGFALFIGLFAALVSGAAAFLVYRATSKTAV